MNEYWLAWHVCTTYGNDKLSHDDRVAWTRDNHALITSVAEDPISAISWEDAGEPDVPCSRNRISMCDSREQDHVWSPIESIPA